MQCIRLDRGLATLLLLQVASVLAMPPADATVWVFDEAEAERTLEPRSGPARLSYYDPKNTDWYAALRSVSTTKFDLPALLGGHRRVMYFPAFSPDQALMLEHKAAPNGVFKAQKQLSNYSVIMDVLWPESVDAQWRALLQTDTSNRDDAELFLDNSSTAGLGINNAYHGELQSGRWYRIGIAIQAASGTGGVGQIHKFIDGVWVGAHITPGETRRNRWAVDSQLLLFADDDGATAPVFLANLMFVPRLLAMGEIEALGGAHAAGPARRGRRGLLRQMAPKSAAIVAHRGNSCCAPENTLVAIRQALAIGVDAVEVDIALTRDGHAILMHDATVDRTTNGQGRTTDLSLAQIRKLDAGSWFDPRYRGEAVPTLTEALRLSKGKAVLYLDVKDARLAPAIARAIEEAKVHPQSVSIWEVGSIESLRRFQQHLPDVLFHWGSVPTVIEDDFFKHLQSLGVSHFEVPDTQLSPHFLRMADQYDMPVTAYTIYDPASMIELISAGVHAIETDFPAQLKRLLPR